MAPVPVHRRVIEYTAHEEGDNLRAIAQLTDPRPFTMPIERGKIREFAAATGARTDVFHDGPAPVVPPTFPTVMAHWTGPENLALASRDLKRILHGEQEYIFHGPPPRAGDVLTGRQRVESEFRKEGRRGGAMRFIVVLTEFHDEAGRLVCEARSTIIETGADK